MNSQNLTAIMVNILSRNLQDIKQGAEIVGVTEDYFVYGLAASPLQLRG
mgnify:CR=1 FL=1